MKRLMSYEVLKIMAMFAVVMIHVSALFIHGFSVNSIEFFIGVVFDGMSRIGVPIFVMVTGALLLNEEKSFDFHKMKKAISKVLFVLMTWSLFYAIWNYASHFPKVSLYDFMIDFLLGHYHLWYLFMLMGLYLITPLLKTFVNKKNIRYVEWFLMLSLILSFSIPTLNMLCNYLFTESNLISKLFYKFKFQILGGYTTYYILGWYLVIVKFTKKKRMLLYILGVLSLLFSIFGTQVFSMKYDDFYSKFYDNLSLHIALYSSSYFVWVQHILKNKLMNNHPIIHHLSQCSFGVYLIHPLLLMYLKDMILIHGGVLELLILYVVTCVLSFMIAYILSHIPYIKKVVVF